MGSWWVVYLESCTPLISASLLVWAATPSAVGPLPSPASPSPCAFCSYSFLSGLLLLLSVSWRHFPSPGATVSGFYLLEAVSTKRALEESSNSDDLSFSYPPAPIPLLCLLASGPWALCAVSNGKCLLRNRAAPILLELATW